MNTPVTEYSTMSASMTEELFINFGINIKDGQYQETARSEMNYQAEDRLPGITTSDFQYQISIE